MVRGRKGVKRRVTIAVSVRRASLLIVAVDVRFEWWQGRMGSSWDSILALVYAVHLLTKDSRQIMVSQGQGQQVRVEKRGDNK
jgi:hypothetical protein